MDGSTLRWWLKRAVLGAAILYALRLVVAERETTSAVPMAETPAHQASALGTCDDVLASHVIRDLEAKRVIYSDPKPVSGFYFVDIDDQAWGNMVFAAKKSLAAAISCYYKQRMTSAGVAFRSMSSHKNLGIYAKGNLSVL